MQTYPYTDENGVLHIRYQDTYTFPHDIRKIEDVVITSTVTGTNEKDPQLLVRREDGKSLYADGCGSATVVFCGNRAVRVQVDPSPINLLFVTGQSNASGDPAYADPSYGNHYVRTAPTMAYYTFCGQQVSIDVEADKALYQQAIEEDGCTLWHTKEQVAKGDWKMPNFADYRLNVTPTLDWETAKAEKGCPPQQFSLPVGTTAFNTCGWNAALAKEWVAETNERVWIVNCSQGGMEIQQFQPSDDGSIINNEYYQAVAVFNLALETLYKEVDAGHFTLHHMAYYWYQGESNGLPVPPHASREYYGYENRFKQDRGYRYLTAEEYVEKFTKMHNGFMRDVVYDHNGVTKTLEYCGIMTIRYKQGPEYCESQLGLNSIRAAQYYMGLSNEGIFANVHLVSNVTEQWVGATEEEANAKVVAYFLNKYGSAEKFKEIFGYDMPTTALGLIPNSHYLIYGHNEMGLDCARNSLLILNSKQTEDRYALSYKTEETPTIRLIAKDGKTALTDTIVFDKVTKTAVVCPQIAPLYLGACGIEMTVLDEGFTLDGNILTCTDPSAAFVRIAVSYNGEPYETYALVVAFA